MTRFERIARWTLMTFGQPGAMWVYWGTLLFGTYGVVAARQWGLLILMVATAPTMTAIHWLFLRPAWRFGRDQLPAFLDLRDAIRSQPVNHVRLLMDPQDEDGGYMIMRLPRDEYVVRTRRADLAAWHVLADGHPGAARVAFTRFQLNPYLGTVTNSTGGTTVVVSEPGTGLSFEDTPARRVTWRSRLRLLRWADKTGLEYPSLPELGHLADVLRRGEVIYTIPTPPQGRELLSRWQRNWNYLFNLATCYAVGFCVYQILAEQWFIALITAVPAAAMLAACGWMRKDMVRSAERKAQALAQLARLKGTP